MGYVINKKGEKIKVNNSDGWCVENVVLINDNTVLVDKYIVNIVKCEMYNGNKLEEEYIDEILFEHEPTDEEIIFYLSKNGINRYGGYATIEKIKTLDFKNESEE